MLLPPYRNPKANGFVAVGALAVSVGSMFLNSASAKKAARKQRAELARREAQLEATSSQAAAGVEAAGRSAAAPLMREAQVLRDTESFRNPLLEQSLLDSVRQQGGQATDRTSTSRNPAAARASVVNQLLQSRGLVARESARTDRLAKLQGARSQLLMQAGQIKTGAAQSAAGIRMSGAQAIAGLPMPEQGPNTTAALTGALNAGIAGISDADKESLNGYLKGLFSDTGSGGLPPDFTEGANALGISNLFGSL